ncbi:MAG: sortase [Clostridia bacterium]|nr:sortase [Clostridia bacterium]
MPEKRSITRRKAGQADRSTKLFRALGILALALGIVTISLFVVKYSSGLQAGKNADKLLVAFKARPTVTPGETMPSPTPSPSPGPTLDPSGGVSEEIANVHRVDDGSDENVDESGDYVQPDAPDHHGEVQELIDKIVASEGEDGVIGLIEIPEIDIELPIIGKWSYKLLKISICRYQGPLPNHEGNIVLIGHNYKSGAHFGNLKKLSKGDEIYITDTATNTRLRYEVYDIETIAPDAFSALKEYRGDCGLTLMTCKNDGNDRLLLRCVQRDAEQT